MTVLAPAAIVVAAIVAAAVAVRAPMLGLLGVTLRPSEDREPSKDDPASHPDEPRDEERP